MSNSEWIDREVLEEADKALPKLLRSMRGWKSLVTEESYFRIERLYRDLGAYVLFLVRCTRLTPHGLFVPFQEAPSASHERIVEGRVGIGVCEQGKTEPPFLHLATFSLGPYDEIAHSSNVRFSFCLDSPFSLHLIVGENSPLMDPNPVAPKAKREILAQFRKRYPIYFHHPIS